MSHSQHTLVDENQYAYVATQHGRSQIVVKKCNFLCHVHTIEKRHSHPVQLTDDKYRYKLMFLTRQVVS